MNTDAAQWFSLALVWIVLLVDGRRLSNTAKRLKRLERWHRWDDSGKDSG